MTGTLPENQSQYPYEELVEVQFVVEDTVAIQGSTLGGRLPNDLWEIRIVAIA